MAWQKRPDGIQRRAVFSEELAEGKAREHDEALWELENGRKGLVFAEGNAFSHKVLCFFAKGALSQGLHEHFFQNETPEAFQLR